MPDPSQTAVPLARRLGLSDAIVIGLGSMIGAGVFAAFTPAVRAAGNGLVVGLVVAAVVALCNATSSAQLAAVSPLSGGAYVYGRERLGPWWGFLAGWSFVIGKTASCAAMALTFAAYALPGPWERVAAVAAVLALSAVNYRGVTRTARLARVIVVIVLIALAVGVAAALVGGHGRAASQEPGALISGGLASDGIYGVLQASSLLFFAFAGYARIATLGEEVRDPARTIPRAIVTALGITLVVYAVVAVTLLVTVGAVGVASSTTPLADAAALSGVGWLRTVVTIGAAVASLGALLALIAGIGRTTLAMAREGDLPRWLAAVHPRFGVPHRAELALTAVICALVLTVDLRESIAFSSFGVLLYYFVANLAALRQPAGERRYPRALAVVGVAGCLALVVTLPWLGIVAGVGVVIVGIAYRLIATAACRGRRGVPL